MAFLAAGGLFVLPTVTYGLNAVTGAAIAVSPIGIFLFVLLVFAGLLGLYPQIAARDSTLAKIGVGLLAVTAAMIISILGVFLLPNVLIVSDTAALAVVMAVPIGATVTVTLFGLASLLAGVHPRRVGGFLLVMAASMSFLVIGMLAYGHSTPPWMGFVVNGLVATSLGAIGSVLRTQALPATNTDSATDMTAS